MKIKDIKLLRLVVYRYRQWLDSRSYNKGKNNCIINKAVCLSTRIQINGNNNAIIVEKGATLERARIYVCGNYCKVRISSGAHLRGTVVYCQDDNIEVLIGNNTYLSSVNIAATEGKTISIGDDCMFAGGTYIKTGDSHSILNLRNIRINGAQDVHIGDHVWVGEGVRILKGVTIENNSVVATGAIVTKNITSNQLWGGVPAKLLKENITWDQSRKL